MGSAIGQWKEKDDDSQTMKSGPVARTVYLRPKRSTAAPPTRPPTAALSGIRLAIHDAWPASGAAIDADAEAASSAIDASAGDVYAAE